MAEIECEACLYNEGKHVRAVYLTIVIGSHEKWGLCHKHYGMEAKALQEMVANGPHI